jgi:hypothetical protein
LRSEKGENGGVFVWVNVISDGEPSTLTFKERSILTES